MKLNEKLTSLRKERLNHFLCGIEEWATLALSHSCGEGCLHPVSLPIAYTADYVKAACSEASADALTLADGYATHPTKIVIDPTKRLRNRS